MKKILCAIIAFITFCNLVALAADYDELISEIEIHVSPAGSDTQSGTADKPLRTVEGAIKRVSNVIDGKHPIRVIFHEGDYRITSGIVMDEKLSGTAEAPITYCAAEGEKPRFVGSVEIDTSKFRPVSDKAVYKRLSAQAAEHVGELDLSGQGIMITGEPGLGASGNVPTSYHDLYLDNKKQTLARWPNDGYAIIGSQLSIDTFIMQEANAIRWGNARDARLCGYPSIDYAYDRAKISAIDPEKRAITIAASYTSGKAIKNSTARYFVDNLLEEIDMPGEWYIDKSTMMLYYYPESPLRGKKLEISVLTNNMFTMKNLSYVTFSGIEFCRTRASVFSFTAACNDLVFENNFFTNVGKMAFENYTYNLKNIKITDSVFYCIGANPIRLGGGNFETLEPSGIEISNNYISYYGLETHGYCGINVTGVGNKINHNIICHSTGTAIQPGGCENEIMYNEIYNVCSEVSDMGAIYSGRNVYYRGNVVRYNYIHDLIVDERTACSVQGVYWDDKLSQNYVDHNIFENMPRGVFMNGGSNHRINNNIFIDCKDNAIRMSSGGNSVNGSKDLFEAAVQFADAHPVYYEHFPEMRDIDVNYTLPRLNEFKDNLLVNSGGFPFVSNEWIKYGDGQRENQASNNIAYDTFSDFNDPKSGNFMIKENAEILQKIPGLADIKISEMGLEGDMKEKYSVDSFKKTYPKNGESGIESSKGYLMWQGSKHAASYHVVVATDPDLKNVVYEADTALNCIKAQKIKSGGNLYYWDVYANTNSACNPKEYKAEGSAYTFTTSKNDTLDQGILASTLYDAKQLSESLTVGDEGGQCDQESLDSFRELIARAETVNKKRYGDQSEVDNINMQLIEATDQMQSKINKVYDNLLPMFENKALWQASESDGFELENKMLSVKKGYVASVDPIPNYKLLRFKMRVSSFSSMSTISIRQTSIGVPWQSQTDYSFYFKKDIIEFQRYVAQRGGGIMEIHDNNGLLTENEWAEIEIGALDIAGGVQVILKVNGTEVFNYVDDTGFVSKAGLLQFGNFGIDSIDVMPSDKTDVFDKSILKDVMTAATEPVDGQNEELRLKSSYEIRNGTAEETDSGVEFIALKLPGFMTYNKKLGGNEIFTFNLTLNLGEGQQGYRLNSSVFEQMPESEECYEVLVDKDSVSLIRRSAGGNQILGVYDNKYFSDGKSVQIVTGTYMTENGMRVLLYADGNTVFDYTDMYTRIKPGYLKFFDKSLLGMKIN